MKVEFDMKLDEAKMLTLSTAYLSEDTRALLEAVCRQDSWYMLSKEARQLLEAHDLKPPSVPSVHDGGRPLPSWTIPYEHGFFVWVDEDFVTGPSTKWRDPDGPCLLPPMDLVYCLRFADKFGAQWVRFDCEAPVISPLTVHAEFMEGMPGQMKVVSG